GTVPALGGAAGAGDDIDIRVIQRLTDGDLTDRLGEGFLIPQGRRVGGVVGDRDVGDGVVLKAEVDGDVGGQPPVPAFCLIVAVAVSHLVFRCRGRRGNSRG